MNYSVRVVYMMLFLRDIQESYIAILPSDLNPVNRGSENIGFCIRGSVCDAYWEGLDVKIIS